MHDPQLISKTDMQMLYPRLVRRWEVQQEAQRREARRIEQKLTRFVRRSFIDGQDLPAPESPNPGIACDQRLLPGMRRHWGELRKCVMHSLQEESFRICEGCRVNHQMQLTALDDRHLVATRGARVPVCSACAISAVQKNGLGHQGCVCDSQWNCCSCREAELAELLTARATEYADDNAKGRCKQCREGTSLVDNVDYCLRCHNVCTYV